MSKVLKVVATVASVAAAAVTMGASLGISAALLSTVALGASIGASLLMKKPKGPQNSPEALDRLRANIDPRTPRKTMVGITALATDIRDEEFTDSQTYFHRFIVCASHKVEAIDEIWFDDKVAWTSAGGVQGEFVGYLTVATRLEGSAGNAINISSRMGSTRRYTGLAYVHLRYKLTGNDKKADSPFAQSITTRITIRGKGAALYDPREDSTVPGGAGTQRADDQSTWVWDNDACRNPALALLFYLLGYKINGLLAVGKGIPPSRIDLESFAVAANLCDEPVAKFGGGTEPRYRCDGIWSEGDAPQTVIEMLKATMNADLDDVDGKLRLTVFHNDLASPVADFTEDDVLGEFVWEPTPSLDQTFNIVRGMFTDPSDTSLYQQLEYPEAVTASPDGIDRIATLNLPMVESPSQAQRLAWLKLNRMQYGAGQFRAEYQATAWKVQKNSVVRQTFAATGFADKLFRVAEMDIRVDGVVPLALVEESADIYGGPTLAAPVDPVASTQWDHLLHPLVQNLGTLDDRAQNLTTLGRATSGFIGSDAYAFSKIADSGSAADGDTVSFASTLSAVPRVIFLPGGKGPTAGSEVQIRPDGLTTSGFTMKAVEVSITPGSTITDTTGTTGSGSDPDRMINRSDSDDPWDGKFKYAYAVTVPEIGPGEPGLITIGIYAKKSSVWTKVGEVLHNSSGSKVTTVTPGTVDYDATAGVYEFGVNVESATSGATLDAFNSVEYTLGTPTETSLTDLTEIPWIAMLGQ